MDDVFGRSLYLLPCYGSHSRCLCSVSSCLQTFPIKFLFWWRNLEGKLYHIFQSVILSFQFTFCTFLKGLVKLLSSLFSIDFVTVQNFEPYKSTFSTVLLKNWIFRFLFMFEFQIMFILFATVQCNSNTVTLVFSVEIFNSFEVFTGQDFDLNIFLIV